MNRFINILFQITIIILPIVIVIAYMLISSDIPVNICITEVIVFTILNGLYGVVNIVSIKINKNSIKFNLVYASIFLLIWIFNLMQSLKYEYHKYDILNSFIGIISIALITFLYFIKYKSLTKLKRN